MTIVTGQQINILAGNKRLRQEGHEFKASLGYMVKPCLKTKKNL
jgi:hypothetical protein